ncbi:unnamed protein product [Prorocentrum cordatum]|uniref:Uncharacterized protein n=1 Tax=Prorocentrum cordatum TaxID=2364126 RepID=A0ABN9XV61_9DINO|nr:unnamed protein product [Polarella glacialis]
MLPRLQKKTPGGELTRSSCGRRSGSLWRPALGPKAGHEHMHLGLGKNKPIRQEAHVYLEVCRAIERAAIHRTSCEHPLEHGLPCRPQEKTAPSKARRNQKSVELTTCHASGLERMSAVPPDSAELKRQRGRRRRQQRGGDKEEENNESM